MVPLEVPIAVTGINDLSLIGSPRQANGSVKKFFVVKLNLQRLICPDRKVSDRSPYTRGGQLVFDWDRLENFLITRDRPGGYKVTNTKYHEMQRFSFLFTF